MKRRKCRCSRMSMTSSARASPMRKPRTSLGAITSTLKDLESGRPMDRLICGDVGFGKTEVALRAAFAVALDGKQVAVVVPTTLLARQHSKNFAERFRGFPGQCRAGLAPDPGQGTDAGQEGVDRRQCRYRGRHPCAARQVDQVQGSRPSDRRRGAALWRQPQGTAEAIACPGACADAERHADPAHAATGADRRARSLDHRLAAGRSARGAHLRGAARSPDDPRGAAARTLPRRAGVLRGAADRGPRRRQGFPRQERAGDEGRGRARPDAADRDRRHHVGVLRRQIRHPALDHDHRVRARYSRPPTR